MMDVYAGRFSLIGLVRCGRCGAPLAAAGKDYLACSAACRLGTCANRKGIRRGVLEGLILDALKHNLMHPDLVAAFIKEFHAEVNRQRREAELALVLKRRELDEVRRKLDGLIEAIAERLGRWSASASSGSRSATRT
jgi:site-specific DNA recombinase